MAWEDLTFATDDSIAKLEREILSLSSTGDWEDKDDLVKLKLGNDVSLALKSRGFDKMTDYESGEKLLDIVTNATDVLELPAEYLKLYFIYFDLSHGVEETIYGQKAIFYHEMYDSALDTGMQLVDLDINHSGETDLYSVTAFKTGRNLR